MQAAAVQAQKESEVKELVSQAQAAFASKNYESAIETCKKVLVSVGEGNEACTTVKQHASVKLAEQLIREGQTHLEKGEFDEALWNAEKALKLDPSNPNAAKLKEISVQMKPHSQQ